MKTLFKCLVISASLLLTSGFAGAALIDRNDSSGHVIYDDVSNKYWVQDVYAFSYQTYQEQIDNINNNYAAANYYGLSTWHMASLTDMESLLINSISDLYMFTQYYPTATIRGRYEEELTYNGFPSHYLASIRPDDIKTPLSTMKRYDYAPSLDTGAWVTADAAPVPEPSTMLLLGSGLIGLVGYGRRRFKK